MRRGAPSTRIPIWLQGALLALLTCVVYLPVVRCGFIWDDDYYVTKNATLRTAEGLQRIWLDPAANSQFYPLTFTSFWIENHLWGTRPLGYHLVNVLLHAASSVLLWHILRRLGVRGASVAAVIFALHPVEVESVAWITERKNVLSAFFYLASALCLLRYFRLDRQRTENPAATDAEPRGGLYGAGLALFGAALLSKTVTASLPAALLLVMWWKDGRIRIRDLARTAPMLAAGAAFGLTTAWLEHHHVGAAGEAWSVTPIERMLIAGRALWFYAGKLLWPYPIIFIYPRWQIDAGAWWQSLFPMAFAATLAALWLLRHRFGRGPVVAVLYFAGTLFPALGFFNIFPMRYSWVADHFQYLASIGPIALFAAVASRAFDRCPRLARAVAGLLFLVLGTLTWRQVGIYRDLETLWRDTVTENPSAWMAHTNLGALLTAQGSDAAASLHFRESIRLAPRQNEARLDLGELLLSQGRLNEAIAVIEDAVAARPDDAKARYNLGTAFARGGRFEEALVQFGEALRLRPAFPQALFNSATALLRLGRLDEAEREYRRLLALDPDHATAHANLATILEGAGRKQEAAMHRAESLRLRATRPPGSSPQAR